MLKKILEDMHVPDDILNNLLEEDKQLLFLEIRKEQLRRYKEFINKIPDETEFKHKPNKNGNNVGFVSEIELVSFLGERPEDKTIEDILKEEALKKAKEEAEKVVVELLNQTNISNVDPSSAVDILANKPVAVCEPKPTPAEAKKSAPAISSKPTMGRHPQQQLRRQPATGVKGSGGGATELINRKSMEVYQEIVDGYKAMETEAAKEAERLRPEWHKVEEQSRQQDEQRRQQTLKVRQLYRSMSMQDGDDDQDEEAGSGAAASNADSHDCVTATQKPLRPPPPPKEKSAKLRIVLEAIKKANQFSNIQEIRTWFLSHEWDKRKIFDGSSDCVPDWFHGAISRQQSETLLEDKQPGDFLMRVSERFPGYVLSYKTRYKTKHVLVEALDNGYQFFGAPNIRQFPRLTDMITHFQSHPISDCSQERLKRPCGQMAGQPVDYMPLLQPDVASS